MEDDKKDCPEAAELRRLVQVCFDENDAAVVVGGMGFIETYVFDRIAELTGDPRDQHNAAMMRQINKI